MTHDTEWPASEPNDNALSTGIEAERLAWCIGYLADQARRSGFDDTAKALEAVIVPIKNDRFCNNRKDIDDIV
ncbi:hypothetical protein [Polymorphum gilvum]|uniref:Uncharacterized protein n=1 Tax=Polymorphum gilvum (strain LMG 25793 / CGMCC 1.9160 / SL003B-26A1) TaxID=991905 RepID=F2J3W6_POLGS|nr:hypothetical protein [Polymorphum gilvum]ADZ68948.1 hypothetical protein SL003B_0515 [Polymorphum gilvum SL003B-26A1]